MEWSQLILAIACVAFQVLLVLVPFAFVLAHKDLFFPETMPPARVKFRWLLFLACTAMFYAFMIDWALKIQEWWMGKAH